MAVSNSAMSDHLFQMVPLGELLTKSEEWIDLRPDQQYRQVTIKMRGQGVVLRNEVSGTEIAASRRLKVRAGQFILSRIDARNGALGLVPETLDGAVVSNDFPAFNLDTSRILPEYLGWMSKTHSFVELCKAASEGTTNRVRLQEDLFLVLQIPLPPLAEQHRIVARIEQLAAKIEEARGLRREAVEEVEALVGAVTVKLLEALDSTPRQMIENVAEVRGGIQKSPDRVPGSNPVRYLTVAHVQRNKILLSDPRYFEVSLAELDRWRLQAGDVLIIEGNGSADHIGRTAIFRGEIDNCVHQNHVIRIRPDRHQIEPDYLNLYLNSPRGQEEVRSRGRTTSGLLTLSVGRINQIQIPVPSFPEQRHIVAYLDSLQAKVDALKALQTETNVELDALLPGVLDKAFKGEL